MDVFLRLAADYLICPLGSGVSPTSSGHMLAPPPPQLATYGVHFPDSGPPRPHLESAGLASTSLLCSQEASLWCLLARAVAHTCILSFHPLGARVSRSCQRGGFGCITAVFKCALMGAGCPSPKTPAAPPRPGLSGGATPAAPDTRVHIVYDISC